VKKEAQEIQELDPHPSLASYYNLLEGGRIIPQKFSIPLFFELEKERVRTHRWMSIAKSKGVEDVGHMENKLKEMGKDFSALRDREAVTRSHLETENKLLRRQLQEKGTQLACMANLSMEELQCRTPSKSYGIYVKDQWLQFQIKTLAQRGTMPFQDYRQFMDLCDQSTLEDKGKMVEFYLHNMALTNMNVWDPNAKLGDLQLMAMASWMNHEELREVEIKRSMIKEQNEPLMIRSNPSDPMALIRTHNLLSKDP